MGRRVTRRIALEPRDPLGMHQGAYESLVAELEADGYQVGVSRREERAVLDWNIFYVWIADPLTDVVVAELLRRVVGWVVRQVKEARSRRLIVSLYGPDGRVIKAVEVKDAGTRTVTAQMPQRMSPPWEFEDDLWER
jgi:hypothetical protein